MSTQGVQRPIDALFSLATIGFQSKNLQTAHRDGFTFDFVVDDLFLALFMEGSSLHFRQKGGRLVYLGAGSSGRYAVADAVECHPTFGVGKKTFTALLAGGHRAIWNSVEGAEDSVVFAEKDLRKAKLNAKDVLIGLTASGRTPYVLAGMRLALSFVIRRNKTKKEVGFAGDIHFFGISKRKNAIEERQRGRISPLHGPRQR